MVWREAVIEAEQARWAGAIQYLARLTDGSEVRALAYPEQVGEPSIGERVILSAAAALAGLGTGGVMFVVALPDRLPSDPEPQPGHIVKARYTPSQWMTLGVDEQQSPYHDLLQDASSIDGMPVITADLHSALPAIAYTIHSLRPGTRVAYVMSDGGALPAWFSRAGACLRELGLIEGTISVGQAYGGELEAVNVHTGLLAAKLVWDADIAIVAQGPGNLGTDTRWGFSGVNLASAMQAAHTLHGIAIAALRLSNGDARERHYGISHHSLRVLTEATFVPVQVAAPEWSAGDPFTQKLEASFIEAYQRGLRELEASANLSMVPVPTNGLGDLLRSCPVPLSTMGRSLETDPASFIGAAAAGAYAVTLL